MNGGLVQIIVVLLVIVAPAAKQILDAIQRKKEAKAIEQERERREHEALRTGSPVRRDEPKPVSQYKQTGQVNAADRLREIQEKRREALERARKQATPAISALVASMPTARPAPTQRARPTQVRPLPSQGGARPSGTGPLIGGRAPLPSRQPAQPLPSQRQAPSVQRQVQPARTTVASAMRPIKPLHAAPVKRKRAAHARQGDHREVHRLVTDAEKGVTIEETHAAIAPRELANLSPASWRKAFVLQEVIGPPMALRNQ